MAHKEIQNKGDMENLGWQKMQVILNKDMPVKKEYNRLAIWWWLGSAAAAVIVLLLLIDSPLYNSNNENNPQVSELGVGEYESESEAADAARLESEYEYKAAEINKSKTANHQNSQTSITQKTIGNTPPEKSTFDEGILTELTKEQKLVAKNMVVTQQEVVEFYNSIKREEQPEQINSKTTSLETYFNTEPRVLYIDMESLVTLPIDELKSSETSSLSITSPLEKESSFHFGILALNNIATKNTYAEVGLGIFGKWDLNQRWALTAGINYSGRSSLLGLQSESLALEVADQSSSPSPIGSSGANTDPLVSISNRDLEISQWSLPIALSYQLLPKWNINGSTNISYLSANETAYSDAFNTILTGAATVNMNALQKWNLHGGVGIGYNLSNRIKLLMEYQWLLTKADALKTNLESDELNFSVQYHLD